VRIGIAPAAVVAAVAVLVLSARVPTAGAAAFWLPTSLGLNDPYRAVAVGDSITAGKLGEGVYTLQSYPVVLQQLLSPRHPGVKVINEGSPGAGAGDVLLELPGILTADEPIAVLIMVGTNDANAGHTPDDIIALLRQMIDVAKAHGVIPILATIPPNFEDDGDEARAIIEGVNAQLPAVAAEEAIRLVDIFSALNNPWFFRVDGLHPEQDGYDLMAATWRPAVDAALDDALTFLPELYLVRFDKEQFTSGETLHLDLTVADDRASQLVDIYFGALLPPAAAVLFGCPGQDPVVFLADRFRRVVRTCVAEALATALPFAQVELPDPLPLETFSFFVLPWDAGFPGGSYTFFFILTPAGDRMHTLVLSSHTLVFAP
jgi:lysophospholipase L1-like esterase